MADQTVRQESVTVLPEYQEKFLKDLLASTEARAGTPTYIPERQVAALAPGQQRAIELGYEGVGAYLPMLQAGEATLGAGAGALETGIGTALSGAQPLIGSMGAYDPRSYQAFMDPYMEDVIQQQYRDIARQGDIQGQQIRGAAVRGGAFGGSRQAVAEQELARNVAEQQARTGAQLRSAGFGTAQQMAQNAFQNQMARQQSAAQIFGQLGQGIGSLGSALAKTGLSQAALGETAQTAQQRDINALLSLGGLEQQQAQSLMEAQRATELERQYEPYQRISFMSDIFRGVPSTQTTLTSQTAPSPSTISQIAGLGVGLAGLSQAGLNPLSMLGIGGQQS
jgi:hypothetical protein